MKWSNQNAHTCNFGHKVDDRKMLSRWNVFIFKYCIANHNKPLYDHFMAMLLSLVEQMFTWNVVTIRDFQPIYLVLVFDICQHILSTFRMDHLSAYFDIYK